jgi:hypothetical protein
MLSFIRSQQKKSKQITKRRKSMDPRAPKNPSFNEILWQLDRLAGASVLDNHATMAAQRARYILAEVQKYFETEEKDQEYTDEIKKMLGIVPASPNER